ncbi:MAG: hypothetical protein M3O64_04330 [Chloroflexota bacterium]|nr:hypothetical protein [Chloroflexota bacterium]
MDHLGSSDGREPFVRRGDGRPGRYRNWLQLLNLLNLRNVLNWLSCLTRRLGDDGLGWNGIGTLFGRRGERFRHDRRA